jgi:hypothetical protein
LATAALLLPVPADAVAPPVPPAADEPVAAGAEVAAGADVDDEDGDELVAEQAVAMRIATIAPAAARPLAG